MYLSNNIEKDVYTTYYRTTKILRLLTGKRKIESYRISIRGYIFLISLISQISSEKQINVVYIELGRDIVNECKIRKKRY